MTEERRLLAPSSLLGWALRVDRVASLCSAVHALCGISPEDYVKYASRRASEIKSSSVRDAVQRYSSDLGLALEWIQTALCEHRKDASVPDNFKIELGSVELTSYRAAWSKHVEGEKQSMIELGTIVAGIAEDIENGLKLVRNESDGEYSSYSDYSEEDTETDEDMEDENVQDEEEVKSSDRKRRQRQRHHHRRDGS